MGPSSFPSMKKFKFFVSGILKQLQDIKIHKAPGPDKIVPRLLHDFAHILAEPLVEIFNKSLETSDIPHDWQTANVVPIFNKSTLDNSPPPNYDKESKDECHHVNNNPRYKWYVKPAAFQVIAPTRPNYGRKINVKNRNKSTILIFLPAIIELVQELLISNMHNKLEEDTCENVEVIVPTRSNY